MLPDSDSPVSSVVFDSIPRNLFDGIISPVPVVPVAHSSKSPVPVVHSSVASHDHPATAVPPYGFRAIGVAVADAPAQASAASSAQAAAISELADHRPHNVPGVISSKLELASDEFFINAVHKSANIQSPKGTGGQQTVPNGRCDDEVSGPTFPPHFENSVQSAVPLHVTPHNRIMAFAEVFAAHFNFRSRLKRLSDVFSRWQCSSRKHRRLRTGTRRLALRRCAVCLSRAYSRWAALAAEQASHFSMSSSKLREEQLVRLSATLDKCRASFSNLISRKRLFHAFTAWKTGSRKSCLLTLRASRFAAKHSRALLSYSLFIWSEFVFEQQRQASQTASATAVLQEQQLQQSRQSVQKCISFYMHRLHLKNAAELTKFVFTEWSKRAALLRRASSVAKKFVLRVLNQCVSRAFISWSEVLWFRSRNLKLAKMISSSHSRCTRTVFVEWSDVTRIQKAAKQVCSTAISQRLHVVRCFTCLNLGHI